VATLAVSLAACHQPDAPTTVSEEPVAVSFDSHGSTLHGVLFPANADPPVATVLLLHGFPGNEREPLELGSRLMAEGINALAFNYRGTWASEGEFGPDAALEDVGAAMDYLSSPSLVGELGVETGRIVVAGSSFGGCMALAYAARKPSVSGVIAVAAVDLAAYSRILESNRDIRTGWIALIDRLTSPEGMIRGPGGEASFDWMRSNALRYDPVADAGVLATKELLLIGGWRDTDTPVESNLLPLVRALQQHDAESLTIEMLDDGHDFADTRDLLATRVISWITQWAAP
jgi:pimeloyl-ACP methyl ester carboxylesterase